MVLGDRDLVNKCIYNHHLNGNAILFALPINIIILSTQIEFGIQSLVKLLEGQKDVSDDDFYSSKKQLDTPKQKHHHSILKIM